MRSRLVMGCLGSLLWANALAGQQIEPSTSKMPSRAAVVSPRLNALFGGQPSRLEGLLKAPRISLGDHTTAEPLPPRPPFEVPILDGAVAPASYWDPIQATDKLPNPFAEPPTPAARFPELPGLAPDTPTQARPVPPASAANPFGASPEWNAPSEFKAPPKSNTIDVELPRPATGVPPESPFALPPSSFEPVPPFADHPSEIPENPFALPADDAPASQPARSSSDLRETSGNPGPPQTLPFPTGRSVPTGPAPDLDGIQQPFLNLLKSMEPPAEFGSSSASGRATDSQPAKGGLPSATPPIVTPPKQTQAPQLPPVRSLPNPSPQPGRTPPVHSVPEIRSTNPPQSIAPPLPTIRTPAEMERDPAELMDPAGSGEPTRSRQVPPPPVVSGEGWAPGPDGESPIFPPFAPAKPGVEDNQIYDSVVEGSEAIGQSSDPWAAQVGNCPPAACYDPLYYFSFRGGPLSATTWKPSGGAGAFPELSVDNGYALGLALGQKQGRNLRSEFEVGYRDQAYSWPNPSQTPDPFAGSNVHAFTGMANGYWEFVCFPSRCWKPYVGAGVGFAVFDTENPGSNSTVYTIDDSTFAYQFIGGMNFKLDCATDLFLEYRYFAADDVAVTSGIPGGSAGRSQTGHFDMRSNDVFAGIRIKF